MRTASATRPQVRHPSRTQLGLAFALGGLCVVLDTTITIVAVPALMREFGASLATMQWTTTAYVLALVSTLPLAARLGARHGPRRTYVAAMLIFALGSTLAALSADPATLIAARVVQGLGGGLINPIAMTMAMGGVAAHERGRIGSLLGLPVLLGPLVGPILSGWLVDEWSWRAIFLVTVPPALLTALLVHRLAPRDPPAVREPLDIRGVALLLPGATLTVFGLGEAALPTSTRLAVSAVGLALIGVFIRHAQNVPAPLLRIALLRQPSLAASLGVLTLFGAAYFGSMLLLPTYVQVMRGDTALTAGMLGVPAALATGLSLQACTRLIDRVAPWRVIATGLTLAAGGMLGLVIVLRIDTAYPTIMALAAVTGAGAGGVLMPMMTAATRTLDGADLASGTAIMGLVQQLSIALGTAAMTAVLAGTVRWQLPGLDGGLEAVPRLPRAVRAAQTAELVTALRVTQSLAILLVLGALMLAVTSVRRHIPPRAEGAS